MMFQPVMDFLAQFREQFRIFLLPLGGWILTLLRLFGFVPQGKGYTVACCRLQLRCPVN